MKRIISIILICLLMLALCVSAFAEDGQTITTEVNEDGTTVTTVDNGNGRVFTVEELPEYGEGEIIPAPTPEPTEEPQAAAAEVNAGQPRSAAAEGGGMWLAVVLVVLVAACVTAVVLVRRKKKA